MNAPIDTMTRCHLKQKLKSPKTEAQLKKTPKKALLANVNAM